MVRVALSTATTVAVASVAETIAAFPGSLAITAPSFAAGFWACAAEIPAAIKANVTIMSVFMSPAPFDIAVCRINVNMEPRKLRNVFFLGLGQGLKVVWPILSVLLGGIVLMGAAVALLEGWRLFEGIYFAFVTSMTIGYGDLVPKRTLSRVLAICIGLLGVLLIGLVAAIAVRAMEGTDSEPPRD